MKKRLYYALFIGALLITLNACSDSCKTCTQSTYNTDDFSIISQGDPAEYCGLELITIQATPDVTIGETVTKWECY